MNRFSFFWSCIMVLPFFANAQNDGEITNRFREGKYPEVITFSKPVPFIIMGEKVFSTPTPLTIKGKSIHNETLVDKAPELKRGGDFSSYLFSKIKSLFSQLPNGNYIVIPFNLVVDEHGKLAYFDVNKLQFTKGKMQTQATAGELPEGMDFKEYLQTFLNKSLPSKIPDEVKNRSTPLKENPAMVDSIYFAINQAFLECPPFSPAILEGKKVCSLLSMCPIVIAVKEHSASYRKVFSDTPKSKKVLEIN